MNNKTFMIFGNGINYSLKNYIGWNIHTGEFLKWKFVKYKIDKNFPYLKRELDNVNNIEDDFKKIENILLNAYKNIKDFEEKKDTIDKKKNEILEIIREIPEVEENIKIIQGSSKVSEDEKKRLLKFYEEKLQMSKYDNMLEKINEFLCNISGRLNYFNRVIQDVEHYIVMAFCNYQKYVENIRNSLTEWEWIKYFQKNRNSIKVIVSLNYDLLIETILDDLNIKYYQVGVQENNGGIAIFKPHGSINYIEQGIVVEGKSALTYPLSNCIRRNNTNIKIIPDNDLLMPREEVDIVSPTQYSDIRVFDWVKYGYKYLEEIKGDIDTVVISGVSYWECDREEINEMIANINPESTIININPDTTSQEIKLLDKVLFNSVKHNNFKHICNLEEL